MALPRFVYLITSWWTFEFFSLTGHCKHLRANFMWMNVFCFFGFFRLMPMSGIAGSCGKSMFNDLRNCHKFLNLFFKAAAPSTLFLNLWNVWVFIFVFSWLEQTWAHDLNWTNQFFLPKIFLWGHIGGCMFASTVVWIIDMCNNRRRKADHKDRKLTYIERNKWQAKWNQQRWTK